ncbi:MAG: CpsD/CapB family tyrosine-protein kinase [Clostridiales bacterium]|nr:CpsD/CapB family tyrosine-protein kinase [Clostridiales bacterium]
MVEMDITHFDELEYQAAEAVNTLCANLSFVGSEYRKIMVTSCHPQEGKSFVTMNLMRSLARLGHRVILIDADIRASALQAVYGINVVSASNKKYHGLVGYLVGRSSIDDIVGKTSIPGAYMILAGRTVTNSLPLFNKPRFEHLIETLSQAFDIILIDTPPVGTIIDAAKIAQSSDGILFVVQSGGTSSTEMQAAIHQIEKTGCPIMGYVLNKSPERAESKYYYSSGYRPANRGKPYVREKTAARRKHHKRPPKG